MCLKFEDTKGVIRSCKLKDRQYNGQTKNDKMASNFLQSLLKGVDLGYPKIFPSFNFF